MKIPKTVYAGCAIALLTGCASDTSEKVFLDNTPIAEQAHPPVLFPDYFLGDGFELHEHGRIPQTGLIGAGMAVPLDVSSARSLFSDMLYAHNWETETIEIGRQSFRIIASHAEERVEIRGVQGTSGPTQVFLLYTP